MTPLIVVLRPLGLGDFLTGVPAYRAIARAFPAHRRMLAAPAALGALTPLVTGANGAPVFDAIVATAPLAPLEPSLHGADVAIDLHGRGPASQRVLLAARPRRLIAFANAAVPETTGFAEWVEDEHEVGRWCRMLDHAGIPCDPQALDLAVPARAVAADVRGATLLHPGAASVSRRWPVERWIEVARAERAAGRVVILTASPDEAAIARSIASAASIPPEHNFAGRTRLDELAALVAASGRIVAGDTGVAHLATAYRRPSVLLFGPTPPAWWGPPPNRPQHRVLWAGRRGDAHGTDIDPGLAAIGVREVLRELDVAR